MNWIRDNMDGAEALMCIANLVIGEEPLLTGTDIGYDLNTFFTNLMLHIGSQLYVPRTWAENDKDYNKKIRRLFHDVYDKVCEDEEGKIVFDDTFSPSAKCAYLKDLIGHTTGYKSMKQFVDDFVAEDGDEDTDLLKELFEEEDDDWEDDWCECSWCSTEMTDTPSNETFTVGGWCICGNCFRIFMEHQKRAMCREITFRNNM